MSRRSTTFHSVFRRAAFPALALGIMAFFGIYAVIGSNGALAYGDYQRALLQREAALVAMKRQQAVLANRVRLLDPARVDPDMADEQARRQLNVINPNEFILPLR